MGLPPIITSMPNYTDFRGHFLSCTYEQGHLRLFDDNVLAADVHPRYLKKVGCVPIPPFRLGDELYLFDYDKGIEAIDLVSGESRFSPLRAIQDIHLCHESLGFVFKQTKAFLFDFSRLSIVKEVKTSYDWSTGDVCSGLAIYGGGKLRYIPDSDVETAHQFKLRLKGPWRCYGDEMGHLAIIGYLYVDKQWRFAEITLDLHDDSHSSILLPSPWGDFATPGWVGWLLNTADRCSISRPELTYPMKAIPDAFHAFVYLLHKYNVFAAFRSVDGAALRQDCPEPILKEYERLVEAFETFPAGYSDYSAREKAIVRQGERLKRLTIGYLAFR